MKRTFDGMTYEGKTVCVGIDVHKKTYSVVEVVEGEVVKKWTTKADSEVLAAQLLRYFVGANIKTVYEAGFSGFVLHRQLKQAGMKNIVVNPASIEVAANNRVKTDQRDARKMATLLEAGRLKGIRIPTIEEEEKRLLTRSRDQMVEQRTSLKNQIRMKFHQMGLIEPEDKREMTHQFVEELLQKSHYSCLNVAVKALQKVWQTLDLEIKNIESLLRKQAQKDPYEATYRSAPGIGFLAARILSNELGNMSQFDNERQLFSYTGLTPSEHSSGETTCKGHITRQGNSRVRHILNQAAWQAISKDQDLKQFFERLYPKTGKKKAIVAVARKLIGRIRAAFRKGVLYHINPVIPSSISV